jgi:gamma-glutamyltranspeptidase
VLGTPGGSRIITMVALATLAFTEGATAEDMVAGARFHHQYLPDELQLEPQALDEETLAGLEALGQGPPPGARLGQHAGHRLGPGAGPAAGRLRPARDRRRHPALGSP